MAGVPTFDNTTATLALSTGYEVALSPESAKVLTGLDGWIKPTAIRRKKTERAGAHGSFSERGWRDERLVTVSGHFYAASRGEAAAFADEIAAFLGDGTEGVLRVNDADLGERWAKVYLTGDPDVVWDGGKDVYFTVDLLAPDPRKYGQTTPTETGVQADGGGLAFPLFTQGRGDLLRENLIPDPSFEYGTPPDKGGTMSQTQIAYSAFPNFATARNDGRFHGEYGLRLTAGGTDTLQYRYVWSGIPVTPGQWLNFGFSASTTTASTYATVFFNDASGNAMPSPRPSTAKFPTGTSVYSPVRLSLVDGPIQVPAGAASVKIAVYLRTDAGTNPLSGAVYLDDCTLIQGPTPESVADSTYLSGDAAKTGYDYEWSGTPGASTSREYALPADGTLYFGEAGSPGTATFTNTGTADSAAILRVDGYAPGFTITEIETGRQLVYTADVLTGQYLILNPNDGTVKLNGTADRSEFLTVREWTRTEGGATSTFYFQTAGPNALLTVEGVPAWW